MEKEPKLVVNEELTQKTAELARLKLTPDERRDFTDQLQKVLEYVEQIKEVNVEGVEPLSHPIDQPLFLREDEPQNESDHILEAAPEVLYDGFKVPPVL